MEVTGGRLTAESPAELEKSVAGPGGAALVRNVTKVFPSGVEALAAVDLDVRNGEFISIVGPSGCGKSTLLRIIAGLTPATSGSCVTSDGTKLAFVFQDPTLLPWRNVIRNAELLLQVERVEKRERRRLAAEALRLVGLEGFERAYPRALSGGMKMRLSLARALTLKPHLFLMDEPFAAVDEITREFLNEELLRIWRAQRFSAIFVTHNVAEAAYLAERVIVMSARPGRIVADVAVPFPHPRTPELRATPQFAELTGGISLALRSSSNPEER